jgi:hypothetical protein
MRGNVIKKIVFFVERKELYFLLLRPLNPPLIKHTNCTQKLRFSYNNNNNQIRYWLIFVNTLFQRNYQAPLMLSDLVRFDLSVNHIADLRRQMHALKNTIL